MATKTGGKMRIADVYEKWNIPIPPSCTHEIYLKHLTQIQGHIQQTPMRIFPTRFDTRAAYTPVFARESAWQWKTLESHLHAASATGVLVRLPLFFQVEPLIFHACKNAGAFLFLNDATNMPVGSIAIVDGHTDTVLTTYEDFKDFYSYLDVKKKLKPRNFIVIHDLHTFSTMNTSVLNAMQNMYIAYEIHLFPGIPLFVQCPTLTRTNDEAIFHLADGYTLDDVQKQVSGTPYDLLPLAHYQLPVHIEEHTNVCTCKTPTYKIS